MIAVNPSDYLQKAYEDLIKVSKVVKLPLVQSDLNITWELAKEKVNSNYF